MAKLSARTVRLGLGILAVWAVAGVVAWVTLDPVAALVGVKPATVSAGDLAKLEQADLGPEWALLEKTNVWGMQYDGSNVVPPPVVQVVEKKVVWNVAATVVRPTERFLLIRDQGSKAMTQVFEGQELPDGSKLLHVDIDAYTVRGTDRKKHTVETSF